MYITQQPLAPPNEDSQEAATEMENLPDQGRGISIKGRKDQDLEDGRNDAITPLIDEFSL